MYCSSSQRLKETLPNNGSIRSTFGIRNDLIQLFIALGCASTGRRCPPDVSPPATEYAVRRFVCPAPAGQKVVHRLVVDGIESYRRFELNENANGARVCSSSLPCGMAIPLPIPVLPIFSRVRIAKNHLRRQAKLFRRQLVDDFPGRILL